jgi:hypothetical protein
MKDEDFTIENLRLTEEVGEAIRIAKAKAKAAGAVKRKPFKAPWAKLPRHWSETLRGSAGGTYELAHAILFEDFKRKHVGGDIVLSETVTGMGRSARARAASELEERGLIKVARKGKHALRVTAIFRER